MQSKYRVSERTIDGITSSMNSDRRANMWGEGERLVKFNSKVSDNRVNDLMVKPKPAAVAASC